VDFAPGDMPRGALGGRASPFDARSRPGLGPPTQFANRGAKRTLQCRRGGGAGGRKRRQIAGSVPSDSLPFWDGRRFPAL